MSKNWLLTTTMASWISQISNHQFQSMRIQNMLAQLEAHPEVTLVRKVLNEGIDLEELEAIEAELGCALAPGIRNFFLEHNGFTLEWHWTGNIMEGEEMPDFEEEAHLPDLLYDYGPPVDGQFMIACLDELVAMLRGGAAQHTIAEAENAASGQSEI